MKTVIYGNGSIARILFSYARSSLEIAGFTVDANCISEDVDSFCGLPLVPFSKVQEHFDPSQYKMIIAMGFIDMNDLRHQKYLEAKKKGYSFTSYVHESVVRHDEVSIDENCIILDFVSIHPGCRIGQGTFISSNVNIGHDCILGSNNWINSGVMIAGGCSIGSGCFFGVNSSVGQGVLMGARNFVAANTLISKNTEDEQVYLSESGQFFKLNSKSFLKFSRMI